MNRMVFFRHSTAHGFVGNMTYFHVKIIEAHQWGTRYSTVARVHQRTEQMLKKKNKT